MAVRSKRLAAGTADGSTVPTVYTVPAGYRTIVKCVSAQNTAASFNRFYLQLYFGAILGYLIVPLGTGGTIDEAKSLDVFQVLNAGESLRVDALHASVNYWISGAELLL